MIALLFCAAAAALSDARAAAALVPASARAAILLDSASATGGLRDFLAAAGAHAAMLEPSAAGRDLRRTVGVDLLEKSPGFLSPKGPRALVEWNETWGLTAPLADARSAKSAQAALEAWLAEAGQARPTRPAPLKGPLAAGTRAGMIAPVAGGLRFLTASGKHAAALVSALAHVGSRRADESPLWRDRALALALKSPLGPAALWLRGDDPLHGALLALDGSAKGLTAHGLVVPSGAGAIFDGTAPGPCAGAPLGCARTALGPTGRTLAARALRQYLGELLPAGQRDAADRLVQRALFLATKEMLRVESLDASLLGDQTDSLRAVHLSAAARLPGFRLDGKAPAGGTLDEHGLTLPALCLRAEPNLVQLSAPCGAAPEVTPGAGSTSLEATFDPAALDKAISGLGPVDALSGAVAAGAVAVHLLWGEFLQHSGPLTLTGKQAGSSAWVEFRWPLH